MDRDQGLSPLPKLHESSQCRMVPKARPPEHKPGGGIIPGACQLWQCTRLAVHALARRQWHGGRALGRLRGRHGHSRDHRWRTRTPADLPDGSLVGSRGPCAIFQGRRGRAKQSRPACFAFARANGPDKLPRWTRRGGSVGGGVPQGHLQLCHPPAVTCTLEYIIAHHREAFGWDEEYA